MANNLDCDGTEFHALAAYKLLAYTIVWTVLYNMLGESVQDWCYQGTATTTG